MSDLVKRLRIIASILRPSSALSLRDCDAIDEAADRIDALEAEVETLTSSGIAEVATKNPSVMDYMKHWEGRAEEAEAENARLRAALEALLSEVDLVAGSGPSDDTDSVMNAARTALKGDT